MISKTNNIVKMRILLYNEERKYSQMRMFIFQIYPQNLIWEDEENEEKNRFPARPAPISEKAPFPTAFYQ